MVKTGTRILKSIYLNGKTSTKTICQETGLTRHSARTCCLALKSRALIKKENVFEERQFGKITVMKKISYWSIRHQKREKVIQMLREAYD